MSCNIHPTPLSIRFRAAYFGLVATRNGGGVVAELLCTSCSTLQQQSRLTVDSGRGTAMHRIETTRSLSPHPSTGQAGSSLGGIGEQQHLKKRLPAVAHWTETKEKKNQEEVTPLFEYPPCRWRRPRRLAHHTIQSPRALVTVYTGLSSHHTHCLVSVIIGISICYRSFFLAATLTINNCETGDEEPCSCAEQ